MNALQRIWARITTRSLDIPGDRPVPTKPIDAMSEIEREILQDFTRDPSRWALREYVGGQIRADSRGVTIISTQENVQGAVTSHSAHCGALEFGPVFAVAWDTLVREAVATKMRTEKEIAAAKIYDDLQKVFL